MRRVITEDPDRIIYCVDLDGTGSMHPASKGDPGAVAYVRADLVRSAIFHCIMCQEILDLFYLNKETP